MPYDSSGNFSLVPSYLAVTGQVVQTAQHNPPFEDIATAGLSAVYVRDGRAPMTGNVNVGAFQIKNMAAGTLATDAVTKGQLVAWEPIGAGSGGGGLGVYIGSSAATFDLTNLSAYRMIELRGFIFGSAAAGLWMRTSSNNGSSYDAGASDYSTQYDGYVNAVLDNGSGANSIIPLTGGATVAAAGGLTFKILCSQFNQATNGYVLGNLGVNTSSQGVYKVYGARAQSTARNALRLLMSTGTMTYFIEARGLRG